MTHLSAVLALLASVSGPTADAPPAPPDLVCRAVLEGQALTTTFQLENGYRLEGIWTLVALTRRELSDTPTVILTELELESLIESDARSGRRVAIPLTQQFRLETEASSQLDALQRTIGAWCATVRRAAEEGMRFDRLAPLPLWRRA